MSTEEEMEYQFLLSPSVDAQQSSNRHHSAARRRGRSLNSSHTNTCDDPFELLSYDSNDLLELKKQMCLKLNTNLFVVLPGIKSKMMLLKNALTKKSNELKKETPKIYSNIMANNVTSNSSATDYSSNSTYSSAQQLVKNSSSSATSSNFKENLKIHLINLLNDWVDKMEQNKNQKNFQITEGIDYEIIVNSIVNKVLIKCQCGIISTLGQKNNSYVLSNYIRHLTNKNPCAMVQEKLENTRQNMTSSVVSTLDNSNTSVDPTLNNVPNSISPIQTSLEKRKRNQTSSSSLLKKKKSI
ncbi:unnamed protein product [Rotaria sp. Silwood1]|nr:unnamed protein product [Rotaria sp. Silwood1]CAF3903793.1 unnamed protein product [Rotaria sp. Silwood1]CAF4955148.1 unnamed protein product [Rotaria sp. Silwood1]CAF4982007.1 unnamed protein product [Rotaria sp. Silwood1]CAF4992403.1 unnamed protein product [Rotaria sp. Silwood1]